MSISAYTLAYSGIPDIRMGGNLIYFPAFHVYFFVGGGLKSIAKLHEGMARFAPLSPDSPLVYSRKYLLILLQIELHADTHACIPFMPYPDLLIAI